MTVTPLSSRTSFPTSPRGRRPVVRRRRVTPFPPVPDAPGLTVSFEVRLTGESRYTDALEIFDTLRRVADRLGTATLEISPGAALFDDEPAPLLRALPDADSVQIVSESRSVLFQGRQVDLTRVEFDLLVYLAEHPRRVFTRAQLLKNVWGYEHTGERTVDVHIRRLRAKLGDTLITTVRSVGYRLSDTAALTLA